MMSCYVLYSRPKAEIVAAENLQKLGIAAYAPTQRQLRLWSDRKKWVNVVMFPNYVFAEAGPERKREIEKVPQILNFVYIGKEIARLTPEDVKLIRQLSELEAPVVLERHDLYAGQQVEILSGPLIGCKGIIINPDRNGRVYLEIHGLKSFVSIEAKDLDTRII